MNGSDGRTRKFAFLLSLVCLALPFPAFCATTRYVDVATSPSGDGLSWATAVTTIQEAVNASTNGDQIWVAEGVYSEHVVVEKSDLSLYGGFSKTETTVGDRDLSAHKTMLDDTGRTEEEIVLLHDTACFVFDGFNTQNATALGVYVNGPGPGSGGTIRNCTFSGGGDTDVLIYRDSCIIENCRFENNRCQYEALCAEGDDDSYEYLIRNCVFENNICWALLVTGYSMVGSISGYPKVAIDRCVIVGNQAGSLFVHGSTGSITNCLIAMNGYGIACEGGHSGSPIRVTHCTITDNGLPGSSGDGIYCPTLWVWIPDPWTPFLMPTGRYYAFPSYVSVANCILSNNKVDGVYFDGESYVTVRNDLFFGNAYAAQSHCYDPNTRIYSNYHDFPTAASINNSLTDAQDNLDGDPAFVNPTAWDFHLSRSSPAIDCGIDLGFTTDLDGKPRPVDAAGIGGTGTFDLGAYEYQDPVVYSPMSGQACYQEILIRWVDWRVAGGAVGISLHRNGQWLRDIAASTANDGEFLWPIPCDLSAGAGYQARVVGEAAPGTFYFSDAFAIATDAAPPNAPLVATGASATPDNPPTWTWTSGGGNGVGTYRYALDAPGGPWMQTTWTEFTPDTALSDGAHRLYVQECNALGVWSTSGSAETVVDTTPPSPPIVVAPPSPCSDNTPTWTWTSAGDGGIGVYSIRLDGSGVWVETSATEYTPADPLLNGEHTLYVEECDVWNRWSPYGKATVTVQTPVPNPPIVTVRDWITSETMPTWRWISGGGNGIGVYRYKINDDPWMETTATSFTPAAPLADSRYSLYVQERDSVGNWSNSGVAYILVDTIPPPTPILTGPASPTIDNTPMWTWTPGDYPRHAYYRFSLDSASGPWTDTEAECYTPAAALPDGWHTFYVREIDSARNLSLVAESSVLIDTRVLPSGLPTLTGARDDGGGRLRLDWDTVGTPTLAQYLGFAYDVYSRDWARCPANGTLWFPFPASARSGLLDVRYSGAYFAWISSQWADGRWLPCLNPQTRIVYSGTPHTPSDAWSYVHSRSAGTWRLVWDEEIYGTWLVQIIV
ncbi:MAG: right-handed parallel beta-helix repeat-containing protein, partial [Candidatus Sumerlaeota bacterium]|nr:right-handed parallel beta-helix repeat-containing protein [Candidatus Sumerlaeota bacterium]